MEALAQRFIKRGPFFLRQAGRDLRLRRSKNVLHGLRHLLPRRRQGHIQGPPVVRAVAPRDQSGGLHAQQNAARGGGFNFAAVRNALLLVLPVLRQKLRDLGLPRRQPEGRGPDFALLEDLASEAFMPLSYGGGVTTVEQAARLFHIGFEKVILNTALIDRPELVRELADRFGSQSVVASIDVKLDRLRRYRCVVAGGTRPTGETPLALAQRAQALGAGEVLLNSVDRDGMMQGYDLKLVRSVADGLTVPLIACGGARDAADLRRVLHEGHAHAAAAGSLFVYFGPLKAVLINVPSEEELCRLGVYQPR